MKRQSGDLPTFSTDAVTATGEPGPLHIGLMH